MAWEPDSQTLGQLALLLRDSLNARNKNAQKNAETALKQAKTNPDMYKYLTYLGANPEPIAGMTADDYQSARSAGIIMLKNSVRGFYKTMGEDTKAYIRSHILLGLKDSNPQLRSYAGNVVTEMVTQGGFGAWPEVLGNLISLVENADGTTSAQSQDGAMSALLKICEDNKKALNKSYNGQRPLDALIPKLLEFSHNPSAKVRAKALSALNTFVSDSPPEAVQMNLENILMQLTQRAEDPDEEVRTYVCRLFSSMTSNFPQLMIPHMNDIIDYIITQQKKDPTSDLALEAAEFIFENNDKPELQESFRQNLGKIIPTLLESMVWNEDDQARLEAEAEEDAEEEDKEQDIAPQFAAAKGAVGTSGQAATNGTSKTPADGYAFEDDESDGEIDEDNQYGDPEEEWNLRKCAASSLDIFSTQFHGEVFQVTLPYLMQNLQHAEWPRREASVLALGAISVGCMDAVQPHLPDLFPYLISLLSDKVTVVRQITCWTLSRYCSWAAQLDEAGWKQYFEPVMEGILQRTLDRNKGVQKAAVSAFATLQDNAGDRLIPYATVIAQQFVRCFRVYKSKNIPPLYDCVQTFAESIGEDMAKPEISDVLMPALVQRWQSVQDGAREIFPLFECLSYVASAMRAAFTPYANEFFSRCTRIIASNLQESMAHGEEDPWSAPDKDFLITSLDLLSSIIQSLQTSVSSQLVSKSSPNMFELISYCMRDSSNDVRQSAYALLGDMAIYVTGELSSYLDSLLQITITQLDLANLSKDRETAERVINNACWALGEIEIRIPHAVRPHTNKLLESLGTILFDKSVQDSLRENAAVAIGRLGVGNGEAVAPHLATFASRWLEIIHQVSYTDEKLSALEGFVNIVSINPEGLGQCLLPFLAEVATCKLNGFEPPAKFRSVMDQYRTLLPNLEEYINHLPNHQQQALQAVYQG